MQYNTARPRMIIPEYGRHIHDLVEHATKIEDKTERTRMVEAIIEVMGQMNPHLRDVADYNHKLWDHIFIISDFKLNIDSPYPQPQPLHLKTKPKKMAYPENNIRYKHYGRGVELLVKKAVELEEGDEKNALIESIANLMKKHYLSWSRNTVDDKIIWHDLKKISRGKLEINEEKELLSMKDINIRTINSSSKGVRKKKRKVYRKKKV